MPMLDWTFARSLGELQVLTRASYALLIVVPLLAGVWPLVRVQVARHADHLTHASSRLSDVLQGLKLDAETRLQVEATAPEVSTKHAHEDFRDAVAQAQSEVALAHEKLRRGAALSYDLPSGWVLGFFAALCATLAHAAYQIGAPEIIKLGSRRAYIRNRRTEFASNFTVGDVELAMLKLDQERDALTDDEKKRLSGAREFVDALVDPNTGVDVQSNLGCALDIIDVHSRVTYDEEAARNRAACAAASCLYAVALILIILVTAGQVLNVLEAAGYLST